MMRIYAIIAVMVFSVFLSFNSYSAPTAVLDDENCMMCHKYPGLTRVNDEGYLRLFFVESERYDHSVHTKVKCSGCHTDVTEIPHKEAKKVDCTTECHIKNSGSEKPFSHKKIQDDLQASIHNPENEYVRAKIIEDFPTCTNCHNNPSYRFLENDMDSISDARHKKRVLQKCNVCHDNTAEYTYFFNHVTHRIKDLAPSEDVVETCSKCHSKDEMAKKHKLKNAAATYLDTFHGKAVEFGLENAPTCIDCHVKTGESAHKIMSYKNPQSATFEENRYLACKDSDCHANPGKGFGTIRMHTVIDKDIYPVEFYTALGFTILTIGAFYPLLGLMILELIRELFPNFSFRRKKRKD
ncbi:multiheme c-type cytochrome [Deferribacteres bacterium DY0037]